MASSINLGSSMTASVQEPNHKQEEESVLENLAETEGMDPQDFMEMIGGQEGDSEVILEEKSFQQLDSRRAALGLSPVDRQTESYDSGLTRLGHQHTAWSNIAGFLRNPLIMREVFPGFDFHEDSMLVEPLINELASLRNMSKEDFILAIGVTPNDSESEKVKKAFAHLNQERAECKLAPIQYESRAVNLRDVYQAGLSEVTQVKEQQNQEKADRLTFWRALPRGAEFIAENQIENLSSGEVRVQLENWLDERGRGVTRVDLSRDVLNPNAQPLSALPPEIGRLTNLQHLNLSYNNLKELPPEIGNLTQLKILDLSANELQELPREMGNLNALRVLNLSANQLTDLSEEVTHLRPNRINLQNNQMSPNLTRYYEATVVNSIYDSPGKKMLVGAVAGLGAYGVQSGTLMGLAGGVAAAALLYTCNGFIDGYNRFVAASLT